MSRQQGIPRAQCEYLGTCNAGAERTRVPRVRAEFVKPISVRQEQTAHLQQRSSKADQELLKIAFSRKVSAHKAQAQAYYEARCAEFPARPAQSLFMR